MNEEETCGCEVGVSSPVWMFLVLIDGLSRKELARGLAGFVSEALYGGRNSLTFRDSMDIIAQYATVGQYVPTHPCPGAGRHAMSEEDIQSAVDDLITGLAGALDEEEGDSDDDDS